jgi:hypothetical protein
MKKFSILIFFSCCLITCTLTETTVVPDDNFELNFNEIFNLKMSAKIDSLNWTPTDYTITIDSGGYSIQGNQYIRKGIKDTIFHIINLDFVFPCEIGVDTMFNGEDFWGFYLLDDNLTANNDKEFDAQSNGIIEIKTIDYENKYVTGIFNFTGIYDKPLKTLKKEITNGIFSFNYK